MSKTRSLKFNAGNERVGQKTTPKKPGKCRRLMVAVPLVAALAAPWMLGGCSNESGRTGEDGKGRTPAAAEVALKRAELNALGKYVARLNQDIAITNEKLEKAKEGLATSSERLEEAKEEVECLKHPKKCMRGLRQEEASLRKELKRLEKENAQMEEKTAEMGGQIALTERMETKLHTYFNYVHWIYEVDCEVEGEVASEKRENAARRMSEACYVFLTDLFGEKYEEWDASVHKEKALIFAKASLTERGEQLMDRVLRELRSIVDSYDAKV